ncbi:MAG TPA: D-aminoacylase [Candidatus Methylomirabilis sp.]|nr:D-aminoacylase [Candidatus Methylomirabilis sp.]
MAWSLLIKNGTVVDGSGASAGVADVAVEGDRVVAVGRDLSGEAARTIDARGLMVAPGFIDIHSHSDLVYDGCPSAESKVRQGVTTEVVGMCSFSPAPVGPGRAELVRDWTSGLSQGMPISWGTFAEYLEHLRRLGPSVNVVQFVGHGALRLATVGPENRPPTRDEQRDMERLLVEAIDAGAFGFSTGLVYAPSVYGSTEELIGLARRMARSGGLYFSHIRGEAATLEDAVNEAIRIGEEGGVPVQISHVKASGRENWGKMDRVLRMIDAARARGLDVTGDVYPYPAGSTKMDNLLPGWMQDGGISKLLERLADPAARHRAVQDCLVDGERWRTGSGAMGWDEIMIATCSRPDLPGLHLAELARRSGKAPADAMMDLVLEERAGVSMIVFSQSEDNVATVLGYAHSMIGSDSLSLHAGPGPHAGRPHPRSYGTFPRVLGVYCRDKRLFSWETAVHKMTGMAAAKLGLKNRGLVRPGFHADLALFDPATVADAATFADPHRHPIGIPWVVVNGQVVVDGPRFDPLPAGRVLTPGA